MLTGIYGQPLEGLKSILAQCPAFQVFLGVEPPVNATAEEIEQAISDAKALIVLIMQGETPAKYALIHWEEEGMSFTRTASGSGSAGYDADKSLELLVSSSFSDYKAELEDFVNAGSAIFQELLDFTNDGVNFPKIDTLKGDKVYRGEEGDDRFYFPVHITLGI